MASKKLYLQITGKHAGLELSSVIESHFKRFSLEEIRELIQNGSIFLDGKRIDNPTLIVRPGQLVGIYQAAPSPVMKSYEIRNCDILMEDRYLIALNKPPGIASDTTRFGKRGTVIEGLEKRLGSRRYIQPVHRLDKQTSGVLLISLKPLATKKLMAQFQERRIEKMYIALVTGFIRPESGVLRHLIRKDPRDPRKQMVHPLTGKEAVTRYKRLQYDADENRSLLLIRLETGRTHQIRVQMHAMGHPVVGDHLYGDGKPSRPMLLHAYSLHFVHPHTSASVRLTAPLPSSFHFSAEEINPEECFPLEYSGERPASPPQNPMKNITGDDDSLKKC